MGVCVFCGKDAGILRSKHKACQDLHNDGYREMVWLAAQAITKENLDESQLQQALKTIAERSHVRRNIRDAIEEGWQEAVDAVLREPLDAVEEEEKRLLAVHERLSLNGYLSSRSAHSIKDRAAKRTVNRLMVIARQAALPGGDPEASIQELNNALDESTLSPDQQRRALIEAWNEALQVATRDKSITAEEEESLVRFQSTFNLSPEDPDVRDAFIQYMKLVVLREISEGVVVQHFTDFDTIPVNLQSSEQLVWAFNSVYYDEVKTNSEFRGDSHGLGLPIGGGGVSYNPQQFRGQLHHRDETVRAGPGLLAITTKHIYYHGGGKSFRIPYGEIVSFQELRDGLGFIRDGRDAKPERFHAGDGWFVYNLVTNLARL